MEALEHLKPATEAPGSCFGLLVLTSNSQASHCRWAHFLHASSSRDGVDSCDGVAPETSRHQQHRGHEADVLGGALPCRVLPRRRDMERGGHVPHDFPDVQEAVDALLLGNDIINHRYPHLLGLTDHQRRNPTSQHDDKRCHVVRWLGFHGHRTVSGTVLSPPPTGHHPEGVAPRLVDDHHQRRHYPRDRHRPHRRDSFEVPRVGPFHASLQVSTTTKGPNSYTPANEADIAWPQRIRENQHHNVLYTGDRDIRALPVEVSRPAWPLLKAQGS